MDVTVNVSALMDVMSRLASSVRKQQAEEARAAREHALAALRAELAGALETAETQLQTVKSTHASAVVALQREMAHKVTQYFSSLERMAASLAADEKELARLGRELEALTKDASEAHLKGASATQEAEAVLQAKLKAAVDEEHVHLRATYLAAVSSAEDTVRVVMKRAQECLSMIQRTQGSDGASVVDVVDMP